MALYVQKPIFWNTKNYISPSGVRGTTGFPSETGYGHEEWNNAPGMLLRLGTQRYRVFHTEGMGGLPLDENAGQTFVFMTASHNGVQQLVGIAGNAVCLTSAHHRRQREELADTLSLHHLWKDAWAVPNVKSSYGYDKRQFMRDWEANLHWIPNWICPADFFWWLTTPVTLNPRTLTGKSKLLGMFSRYTKLELEGAKRFLNAIPVNQRHAEWDRLADAIGSAPVEPLPAGEIPDGTVPVTSVLTSVNARRGQGQFREDLLRLWGGSCSVTGLQCRQVLRASHIKPWALSTPKERLDENNGLLLSANLDSLFDKGLITFDANGDMRISSQLNPTDLRSLGLPMPLRSIRPELLPYLEYHRDTVFQP